MKKKEVIWKMIKGTAISIVVAIIVYIVLCPMLIAVLYPDDPPGHRDFTSINYCIALIYVIVFYFTYIKKSGEDSIPASRDKFDPMDDLKNYLSGDGKILLILYAIMLVIYIISKKFLPLGNPLTFIGFPFIISDNIPIPFLSEIIAYVVEMAAILALTVYQHYRDFVRWNKNKF